MPKRSWYSIEAKAGKKEADVFIYDTVGIWGVAANDFVRDLNEIDAKTINLRINSPGGNVFDGVAIFNALKKHDAKVITHIEALAASIASIIALAGDEVQIADNAFYMIHNPYTWAVGDAASMRKTAGMLDKVTDSLIKTYTNKTGKAAAEIRELMDDETWFTADEAKEAGFADLITDEEEVEAAFDLSVFNNVPQQVFNTLNATKPSTRKLEHALREVGGLSKADAKAVVAKGYNALDHREDGKGESQREVDAKLQNNKGTEGSMDKAELKEKHLDTYNAIVVDAQTGLSTEVEVAAKVKEGVDAENKRILALDALIKPGREKMIADFKADGSTTAEAAAVQILAYEDQKLDGKKKAIEDDAAEVVAVTQAEPGKKETKSSTVDDDTPLEERCRAAWDGDKELRAEFGQDYDAYVAYMEADESGHVRILGKKA